MYKLTDDGVLDEARYLWRRTVKVLGLRDVPLAIPCQLNLRSVARLPQYLGHQATTYKQTALSYILHTEQVAFLEAHSRLSLSAAASIKRMCLQDILHNVTSRKQHTTRPLPLPLPSPSGRTACCPALRPYNTTPSRVLVHSTITQL